MKSVTPIRNKTKKGEIKMFVYELKNSSQEEMDKLIAELTGLPVRTQPFVSPTPLSNLRKDWKWEKVDPNVSESVVAVHDDWGWEEDEDFDPCLDNCCQEDCLGCPHYVETYVPVKIVFSHDKTVCTWGDESKTTVNCHRGDYYSKEDGVSACIVKKVLQDSHLSRQDYLRMIEQAYVRPSKTDKKNSKKYE
jgi:hypothetical protein